MNDIERQLCLISLARKYGENKTIHDRLETLQHDMFNEIKDTGIDFTDEQIFASGVMLATCYFTDIIKGI